MPFDLGSAAGAAAASAQTGLVAAARTAGERSMGAIAHRALFAEALLGALKARVDEFKAVAK